MPTNFGVYVDDDLAERIEDKRIRETDDGREIESRSQTIGELLRLGVVVDDVIDDSDLDLDRGKPREAFARQALLDLIRAEEADG